MAEITKERIGELLQGVLQILGEHPDGLPAREVIEDLEHRVPPTEFEATDYPNRPGVRRYGRIVRFLTIAPVKAGWIVKNRGTWTLTDAGDAARKEIRDPAELANRASSLYREWKRGQPSADEDPDDDAGDDISLVASIEEAEESAWARIQDHLTSMPPYDFQQLVAGLLRGMGYHVAWVSPPGPDQGVDIIAYNDPFGVDGPRLKVQVKRTADRASSGVLRSFLAVLGDGDVGLFVCAGGFTKDAETEARTQERRRITLLDLKSFFGLWVESYDDIPDEARRLLPLKPVHFLAPDE